LLLYFWVYNADSVIKGPEKVFAMASIRVTTLRRWAANACIAVMSMVTAAYVLAAGNSLLIGSDKYLHFDVHAQAVEAGEVRNGWVPMFLPESMYDIHAHHDVDTGQAILRFSLPKEVMTQFAAGGVQTLGFDPAEPVAEKVMRRTQRIIPDEEDHVPDLHDPGFQFYGGKVVQVAGPTVLAVHADAGIVYLWTR
jgi:hypothetical protein